jgi:hypothetical protein
LLQPGRRLADVTDVEERTIAPVRWVVVCAWLCAAVMLGLCIALALTNLWAPDGAGWFLVPKDQSGSNGIRLNPVVLGAFGLAFAFNAWRHARVRVVIGTDRVTIVNPYRRCVLARSEIGGVVLGKNGHVYVEMASGRIRVFVAGLPGGGNRTRRTAKLADALGVPPLLAGTSR